MKRSDEQPFDKNNYNINTKWSRYHQIAHCTRIIWTVKCIYFYLFSLVVYSMWVDELLYPALARGMLSLRLRINLFKPKIKLRQLDDLDSFYVWVGELQEKTNFGREIIICFDLLRKYLQVSSKSKFMNSFDIWFG